VELDNSLQDDLINRTNQIVRKKINGPFLKRSVCKVDRLAFISSCRMLFAQLRL
jgi:hypothetical protein